MRRNKKLSDADRLIWDEVAKSVDPLRPKVLPSKSLPLVPATVVDPKKRAKKVPSVQPFEIGCLAKAPLAEKNTSIRGKTVDNMDRRNFERLSKGKKEIDLTIDLHGMTLDHAKSFLEGRLQQAYAHGDRLVLVITGKGNRTSVDEFNRPRAGVLRQNLPEWCNRPPLSAIILQVVQAQQKHGGAGAYYVYLKRAR